jgi:hypothetical protein
LTVELRPSAALHIVADMSIDLSQRPIEYSIESGHSSSASASDEDRAAIDVSRRLRELLHGDLDASARAQRVVVLTARREPAALPHFDLARTPDPSFGAHTRLMLPERLPWVIDDLPTGVQVDVQMRLGGGLRVGSGGDFAELDELRSLYLDPASTSRLVIERDAFGTVRGQLGDFVDGDHELWIEPERTAPNVPRVVRRADEKGAFELELVPAGRQRLSARWTTTNGAVAEYTNIVEVPTDDVLDVGELHPESSQPGLEVTIALSFKIDGADAAPHDTRLRDGTWTVELHRPDAYVDDDAPLRSVSGRLGEVPVFESVMPGRYQLVPRYEHGPSDDAIVLRSSHTWSAAIDLTADSEHPLVLALLEHHRTTVHFSHADGADLDAHIVRVRRSGRPREFAGMWTPSDVHDIGDGAPREFLLARGTWIVEARRGPESTTERTAEPSVDLVGFQTFVVGADGDPVVTLELTPACTLEFAGDFAYRDLPADSTMPLLYGAESIHIPELAPPGAPACVFTGLLPDTDYTLEHLGRTFRTGAPGSVTRIDS